jgi:hypothetical protein
MFIAKEIGKTEKGSTYVIGQDTPSSFHISVSYGNNVIYDFIENPPSIEFLKENVKTLEEQIISMTPQYDPEMK